MVYRDGDEPQSTDGGDDAPAPGGGMYFDIPVANIVESTNTLKNK